jgi:hypothetical protein
MWLNVSTDITPWAEMTIFRGIMDWPANRWIGGEVGGMLFQFGLKANHSFTFRYDSCVYNSPVQPNLKAWQWNHVGVQMTPLGQISVYWNGRLAAGPVLCGKPLVDYAAFSPQWKVSFRAVTRSQHTRRAHLFCMFVILCDSTCSLWPCLWSCSCRCVCLQLLRIGPNILGVSQEEDSNWWPIRMELGAVSFFSRTLLPEEWHLAAMSPPLPIEAQALPFTQITLPPLSLPANGNFTWAVYPPSWFGGDVTLYVGANVAGAFSGGTEVKAEVANAYTTVRKLVWTKAAAGTAGAATVMQSVDIVMPLSSGCIIFTSWTAGDTAHYRSVFLSNFTICVSSVAFLQSKIVVNLDLSAPPNVGRYPYIPMSTSPPTGLAQFRYATSDNINFYSTTDRAMGTPSTIAPTHSTGISVLINVMHAREQWCVPAQRYNSLAYTAIATHLLRGHDTADFIFLSLSLSLCPFLSATSGSSTCRTCDYACTARDCCTSSSSVSRTLRSDGRHAPLPPPPP